MTKWGIKSRLFLFFVIVISFISGISISSIFINSRAREEHEQHGGMDGGHREDEPENEHAEEAVVLSLGEIQEFGITTGRVKKGTLLQTIELSGEVSYNENRFAHIVPRIGGVVSSVNFYLGDSVKEGDVLAIIESRELADSKATYLASLERTRIAKVRFEREKSLWEKKISPEQDYLDAMQLYEEVQIQLFTTKQKLHALGISKEGIVSIEDRDEQDFTSYQIKSPLDGTIVEKHIVLGERAQTDTNLYTVADLNNVWVDLTLYPKDILHVAKGQRAFVKSNSSDAQAEGHVEYVSPYFEESTRSAAARVVLDNKDGRWRPGMFVTADIAIAAFEVAKKIRLSALQVIDGRNVVFVRHEDGFEPISISTGRSDGEFIEVIQGLEVGDEYVTDNSFVLKAEQNKSSFGGGHGH